MGKSFTAPVDIVNRALQYCGVRRIAALTDTSKQAAEANFAYDKLRRAELRSRPWRFATRRANLQPITATSLRIVPSLWASGTTYTAGAIVRDATGIFWISQFASNVGNTPGADVFSSGIDPWWQQYFGPIVADLWSSSVTYQAGDVVYKAGPAFYISLINNNLNNDPAVTGWTAQPVAMTSQAINFFEPAGPASTIGGKSRIMFAQPNGYLRVLYPDPMTANTERLPVSAALRYQDLQFENKWIISNDQTTAFVLRFVADVQDVTLMEDMFCEMLAARMAFSLSEILTQSNIKQQAIAQAYQRFATDARTINLLEIGSTEPMEEVYELTQGPQGVREEPPGATRPAQ